MKGTRIIQGLALGGALLAVTWLVVVPAFGSSVGSKVPPPSVSGSFRATTTRTTRRTTAASSSIRLGGAPTYAFRIKDGTSKKYTDPATGATFTLTVNPPNSGYPSGSGSAKWPAYANGTYFSFTSTGAAIVDVGVDGDNEKDATRYSYSGAAGGSVSGDGYLHASALRTNSDGSPRTLDGLDDMSFCYNTFAPISGKAFIDANGNGTNDDAADTSAGGLTVTLFNGSGTSLGTTTTASDGSYTFAKENVGAAYKVCIGAPTADANGYLQTVPALGPACAGPASVGYMITSSARAARPTRTSGSSRSVRSPARSSTTWTRTGRTTTARRSRAGPSRCTAARSRRSMHDRAGRLVQVQGAVLDLDDLHALRDTGHDAAAAGGHLGAGVPLPSADTSAVRHRTGFRGQMSC